MDACADSDRGTPRSPCMASSLAVGSYRSLNKTEPTTDHHRHLISVDYFPSEWTWHFIFKTLPVLLLLPCRYFNIRRWGEQGGCWFFGKRWRSDMDYVGWERSSSTRSSECEDRRGRCRWRCGGVLAAGTLCGSSTTLSRRSALLTNVLLVSFILCMHTWFHGLKYCFGRKFYFCDESVAQLGKYLMRGEELNLRAATACWLLSLHKFGAC